MSITTVFVQYFITVHEIISRATWDRYYGPSFTAKETEVRKSMACPDITSAGNKAGAKTEFFSFLTHCS